MSDIAGSNQESCSSDSRTSFDSDDGLDAIVPRGPDASIADYKESVKHLQLLVGKLQQKIRTLKDDNAELRVNQRKRRARGPPKELSKEDDRVALLGRKYGVMVELFIPVPAIFKKPCPSPAPSFDNPERYRTKASAEAGLIVELHAFIGDDDLIKLMKSPHFHATFEKASSGTRSTIINNLRSVMGKIINLPAEYFETSYNRENVPEIRAMLGVTVEKPRAYTLLFPALYPDLRVTDRKLLGNWEVLAKILKVALFGPKSLQVRQGLTRGGPKTNGQLWGVTVLTPGAVAWAITMLLFMLSPDTGFPGEGTGLVSKIPYKDWFTTYKTILIQRWTSDRVQVIIRSMNHFIFGSPTGSNEVESTPDGSSLGAALDSALAQLDIGLDDDENEVAFTSPASTLPQVEADLPLHPNNEPINNFQQPSFSTATPPILSVAGESSEPMVQKKGRSKKGKEAGNSMDQSNTKRRSGRRAQ